MRTKTGNKKLGDLSEKLAAKFLKRRGYEILTKKYRGAGGEIDIVAKEKGSLVFVEVRSKSGSEFGLPYETINYEKRKRLEKTAVEFQKRFKLIDRDSRFDCVSVLFDKNFKVVEIDLIKDAFWS
ncbi:MAG: YraN family protein [Candidatus Omnitrophota bacterium]